MSKIMADEITIRWWDGFKQTYKIREYEPGCDYLWLNLDDSMEKWIPTRMVRWFSPRFLEIKSEVGMEQLRAGGKDEA